MYGKQFIHANKHMGMINFDTLSIKSFYWKKNHSVEETLIIIFKTHIDSMCVKLYYKCTKVENVMTIEFWITCIFYDGGGGTDSVLYFA